MNDLHIGRYALTGTVDSTRKNLFLMDGSDAHHIGTLVSGSKTKIARFDEDCKRIIEALAAYDEAHPQEGSDNG